MQPLDPPYPADVETMLAKWMPPGSAEPLALFRLLVKHPALSELLRPLGAFQLSKESALPLRDRELVIDRTCARCGCEYEWGVHAAAFGARAGLTPEQIDGTVNGHPDDAMWTDRDRLLLKIADALHDDGNVSDEVWIEARATWSEPQLMEIAVLAGFYHIVSFVANLAGLGTEAWATRFPARA
jgi:alkylhydroperoxidase family enzyme